jgi:hypothetical protein
MMQKHFYRRASLLLALVLCCVLLVGCGGNTAAPAPTAAPAAEAPAPEVTEAPAPEVTEAPAPEEPAVNASGLADGTYSAKFDTDSSMFHVNEAHEGRGILTVKNGEMTIHISLGSQKIVNLFCGSAEDAQKDGAAILEPTLDTVTYPDGLTDEVYGFDVPVPAIGEEFPCALIGTKGVWYDHMVMVSDPQPVE